MEPPVKKSPAVAKALCLPSGYGPPQHENAKQCGSKTSRGTNFVDDSRKNLRSLTATRRGRRRATIAQESRERASDDPRTRYRRAYLPKLGLPCAAVRG